MPPLLFYLLALITLGFGFLVVTGRNPVTCALALAALIAVAPRREIGGLRRADQVVGFAHGFLS